MRGDVQELLEKCHPLGMFDSIATLAVARNMRELYRLVLDLDDMNVEIMRNTLYKAYLEDFYRFCRKLGGATMIVGSYTQNLAYCEYIPVYIVQLLSQVRGVMEKYPPYQSIFSRLSYGGSQLLDKAFYEEEFHYAVFFAYMRLREQEIRNLMWISECVAQNVSIQPQNIVQPKPIQTYTRRGKMGKGTTAAT
ncbi:hypothetical protein K2173_020119 [Erythroxylum novogranatense]|uniref:Uncharacterized protein n=1 Tax=Erythroxylum novogranatense TaxID=1862640 RepID=A0AAV8U9V7_9ROSI|nr:hypothetical protein K2173_020119 [Erythroxylum novogranatense]